MAAAIVYEGVGGGGNLFEGIKFYVLQRVPDRTRWIGLIEANGGEVVKEEKRADMLIADHAKKNSPVGSISWTYIQKSAELGELQDTADHRAGPVAQTDPAPRSSHASRTSFTQEDDRELMEWCIKAERKGMSLKGNELYKQLAAKNNRHPAQSWRDRWVKYLSLRPRPKLPKNTEESEEEEPVSHQRPQRPAKGIYEPVSKKSSTTSKQVTGKGDPKANLVLKSAGGTIFTQDETDLLLESYEDIMNLDEDQVIDAWTAWSGSNPRHTAQEWRNYFKEYIVPKMKAENKPEKAISSVTQPARSPLPKVTTASAEKTIPVSLEVRDSQASSAPKEESVPTRDLQDPVMVDEALFREELSALAHELEFVVDFSPIIAGHKVSLFRLFQIVESHEFGGHDKVSGLNQWSRVAEELGFDSKEYPSAAEEVKACYGDILADYADARDAAPYEEEVTSSQEEAMANEQIRQEANLRSKVANIGELDEKEQHDEVGHESHDDNLDHPQSSPLVPGQKGKRRHEIEDADKFYNKRQRIDKGKGKEIEIPPTPSNAASTPVFRSATRLATHAFSSPLGRKSATVEESSEEDVETPTKNPKKLTPRPKILEPETQDFHFLPGGVVGSSPMPSKRTPKASLRRTSTPPESEFPQRNDSNVATRGSVHSTYDKTGSSTQSDIDSQDGQEIEDVLDHWVSLGYPQDIVIAALEATTFELGPDIGIVCEHLSNEDGLPPKMQGVWTAKDDDMLGYTKDSVEYKAVVKKHGIGRIAARKKFLRDKEDL